MTLEDIFLSEVSWTQGRWCWFHSHEASAGVSLTAAEQNGGARSWEGGGVCVSGCKVPAVSECCSPAVHAALIVSSAVCTCIFKKGKRRW